MSAVKRSADPLVSRAKAKAKSVQKGGKDSKQANQRKAKEPPSPEEKVKKLYGSLISQIDGGHWKNAIKSCDRILRISPDDEDAVRTKVYLYLQVEQNNEALNLISSSQSQPPMSFEKSYALYKLGKVTEARSCLDEGLEDEIKRGGNNEWGMKHLKAQICYREGSFEGSSEIYAEMLDGIDPNSEEYSDIQTNLNASQSHLDFINSGYRDEINKLPGAVQRGLEDSSPPSIPTSSAAIAAVSAPVAKADETGPQKEKAGGKAEATVKPPRKKRLPKNVVLGTTPLPDPERWLKKAERTSYQLQLSRGRGKKGTGASQGVVLDDYKGTISSSGGGGGGGGGVGGKKGKKKK